MARLYTIGHLCPITSLDQTQKPDTPKQVVQGYIQWKARTPFLLPDNSFPPPGSRIFCNSNIGNASGAPQLNDVVPIPFSHDAHTV